MRHQHRRLTGILAATIGATACGSAPRQRPAPPTIATSTPAPPDAAPPLVAGEHVDLLQDDDAWRLARGTTWNGANITSKVCCTGSFRAERDWSGAGTVRTEVDAPCAAVAMTAISQDGVRHSATRKVLFELPDPPNPREPRVHTVFELTLPPDTWTIEVYAEGGLTCCGPVALHAAELIAN